IADGAAGLLGSTALGTASEIPEHAERIAVDAEVGTKPGGVGARGRPAAVHAHLPGRTMADDRLALIAGDIIGTHAGEKIVGVVVLADVLEAEAPILGFAQPPLGRAVGGRRLTGRPFAGRALGAQPAVLVGPHPDAIEEGRVAGHDRSVWSLR